MIWRTRSRSFDLSSRALIMGIVNVTPDSFSDGGLHATTDAAVSIALDPGIGFGKRLEDNLAILRHPDAFSLDGRPVLLGVSRKSFIGQLTGSPTPASRDWPTVALTSLARERGARILRVHDVLPNAHALRMTEAILAAS